MELITIAIYSAIICTTVIDLAGLMEWMKRKYHRIRYTKGSPYIYRDWRPLDCGKCLSFWTTIIWAVAVGHTEPLTIFIAGCAAALLSTALRKYIIII